MKKILYIFLATAMCVFLFTACGENSDSQPEFVSFVEIETISKKDEIIYLSTLDTQGAIEYLQEQFVSPIACTGTMWTLGFDRENPPEAEIIMSYLQMTEVDRNPKFFIDNYEYDDNEKCVYVLKEDLDYFVESKFGVPEGYCENSTFYVENKNRYKFYTTGDIGCVIQSETTGFRINENTVDIYCKFYYPDEPRKNTYGITIDNYGGYLSCYPDKENLLFTADKLTDILSLCLDENTTPENPDFNLFELATRLATEEDVKFGYHGLSLEYDDPSVKRISYDVFNQVKMQIFGTELTEEDIFPFTYYPTEDVLEVPVETGWGMETYYAENIHSKFNDDETKIITTFELFAPDSSSGDPDSVSIGNYMAVYDVINEYDITYLRLDHFEKA